MTNAHSQLKALAAAIALALGGTALAQSSADRSAVPPGSSVEQRPGADVRTRDAARDPNEARSAQTLSNAPETAGQAASLDALADQHEDLSTFAAALKSSGLDETLADGKRYTVFAPTNDALEDKRGEDIEDLLKPENHDDLVGFLRAHIVSEPIDLQSPRTDDTTAKALDGSEIEISRDKGVVEVGDAKVVNANGVDVGNLKIYAIDDVLARKGKTDVRTRDRSDTREESERASAPTGRERG